MQRYIYSLDSVGLYRYYFSCLRSGNIRFKEKNGREMKLWKYILYAKLYSPCHDFIMYGLWSQ